MSVGAKEKPTKGISGSSQNNVHSICLLGRCFYYARNRNDSICVIYNCKGGESVDEELFENINRRLNGDSPDDVLYEALEAGYDEVIVIGKRGNETEISFDYQDDLTALGMLKLAENRILEVMEDD